ncbi:MAG: hypothetical protein FD166_2649 [Bacteroidetes bacterium]|nr:MAG: hypothetical protein FD166_2649 [Bacteroidota bacterium]
MKSIMIFVSTEYHLLLAVNLMMKLYNNAEKYNIELYIRGGRKSKRLNRPYDFSHLPVKVLYFDEVVSSEKDLAESARNAVIELMDKKPDIFIFFQEQDVLMVILSDHFHRNGSEVILCQDGLKPYAQLQFHSLGLFLSNHRQNLWLKKNGFKVENWLSPITSKHYGFLRGISKLYLTSPDVYRNWNGRELSKIEMLPIPELDEILSRLFAWDDALLPACENVIFYMNQPMKGTNNTEIKLLDELGKRFPHNRMIIKAHPLTSESTYQQYENLANVSVIRSTIPAELFIIKLKNSLILSINSTSMLLNVPANKYYYLYMLFRDELKRLSRMKIDRYPAEHVIAIHAVSEISFY